MRVVRWGRTAVGILIVTSAFAGSASADEQSVASTGQELRLRSVLTPLKAGEAEPAYLRNLMLAYGGRVVPPMDAPHVAKPGGSATDEQGMPKKWDRALPFFAQRVVDKGIDLPNPYDVGLTLYVGREERLLSDLEVGFNANPMSKLGFVTFPNTKIENQSVQAQVGAWLFPFMNVYAIGGYTHGGGDIDIAMPGRDLMQYLGVPGCNLAPGLRPELCNRTLTGTARANYEGYTYGLGITLAGAYKNLFFSLPVTYVISDVSVSDTLGKTWNIAPRIGYNQHLKSGGLITWYTGGTYLKSEMNITGTFTFATAGTAIGQDTTMRYSITVEPKDNWNWLAGVNWMITKRWGVLGEVGYGGTRQDVILAVFYRF